MHPSPKAVPVPRSGNWIATLPRRPPEAELPVADKPPGEEPQLPKELLPPGAVDAEDVEEPSLLLLYPRFRGSRTSRLTEYMPANPISAAWPKASGTCPIS